MRPAVVALLVAAAWSATLAGCAAPSGEQEASSPPAPGVAPPADSQPPATPGHETSVHEVEVNASAGAAGVTFLRTPLPLPALRKAPGGGLLEVVVSSQAVGLVMVQVEDTEGTAMEEGAQSAAGDRIRVPLAPWDGERVAYFSARSDGSVAARASCLVYLTTFAAAMPEGFTAVPEGPASR